MLGLTKLPNAAPTCLMGTRAFVLVLWTSHHDLLGEFSQEGCCTAKASHTPDGTMTLQCVGPRKTYLAIASVLVKQLAPNSSRSTCLEDCRGKGILQVVMGDMLLGFAFRDLAAVVFETCMIGIACYTFPMYTTERLQCHIHQATNYSFDEHSHDLRSHCSP